MSTGSCVYYIQIYGGFRYNHSSVFVGNVNLNARCAKQIAYIDHVGYYSGYNPADPVTTSGYDVGYVLVRLFISYDFVIILSAILQEVKILIYLRSCL